MNKTELITLALQSPFAPEKICNVAMRMLFKYRTNSTMFAIYFQEISGLDYKDARYTINRRDYPEHIWDALTEKNMKKYGAA
jgi:hypothetical protein